MKKKRSFILSFITYLFLFSIQMPVAQATTTVAGTNYAPYYFHDAYNHVADFMEFDDYEVIRNYPADEANVYQFNFDNNATNTVYVYQIQDDGIYELAYFPHEDPSIDYRYHSDSTDTYQSLILPSTLTAGQVFYQGYYQDEPVFVVDILDSFTHLDTVYQNVVVLEKQIDNYTYTTYLAPHTGIILENKVSDDGQFDITTELFDHTNNSTPPQTNDTEVVASDMRILSYDEAVEYAKANPHLVEQFKSVIEYGYGEFHNFTDEQIAALPEDAYFNTLVLHKTSMPTGGDPSTTVNFISTLYPEILGSNDPTSSEDTVSSDNLTDYIDVDFVIQELQAPSILGDSFNYEQAQEVFDTIIDIILKNHHNYTPGNRQAFGNAVIGYLPGGWSNAEKMNLPMHFYDYIDSLNAGTSSSTIIANPEAEYYVDMSQMNGRRLFESHYPNFKQIEIDFRSGILSYQGSIANDPATYDVTINNDIVNKINVAHFDEAKYREVFAQTNLNIFGQTANYRSGTDAAYLFYNSDGGISLALPDLKNELQNVEQQTWIEYQMVE